MTLKDLVKDGKLTANIMFYAGHDPYVMSTVVPAGTAAQIDEDGDYVLKYSHTEIIVHPDAPVDGPVNGYRIYVTTP